MWVIITLASLVVLIALVLSVPVDLGLHVDVYGRPKFGMRFAWLFGLVSKEITGEEKKPEEKKPEEPKKKKPRTRIVEYDPELGQTVVRHRRKASRKADWDEFEEYEE